MGKVRRWWLDNGKTFLVGWFMMGIPLCIVLGIVNAIIGLPKWVFLGGVAVLMAPMILMTLLMGIAPIIFVIWAAFVVRTPLGRLAYLLSVSFLILVGERYARFGAHWHLALIVAAGVLAFWLILDTVKAHRHCITRPSVLR